MHDVVLQRDDCIRYERTHLKPVNVVLNFFACYPVIDTLSSVKIFKCVCFRLLLLCEFLKLYSSKFDK
jgi:hypothetical protein